MRVFACAVLLWAASAGRAQVIFGTVETFDVTAPNGAVWNVDDTDPFAGWHYAYINHDPTAVNLTPFWFGNTEERHYGIAVDQPYPGTRSGATEGTLLVQHDCCWGNATDPSTGQPYNPSSNVIVYISFTSVPNHIYRLSAWINTIENQVDPPTPAQRDGIHPVVVSPAQAGFPGEYIGLKNGRFDAEKDFTAAWTPVTGLVDKTWVPTPVIEVTATGREMTVILQTTNPDTKCGAAIITNTVWDDIHLEDLGPACRVPAVDVTADTFVDMEDFAVLQTCLNTSNRFTYDALRCGCFDRNGNDQIDNGDVAAFITCAAGPRIPVDPVNCP